MLLLFHCYTVGIPCVSPLQPQSAVPVSLLHCRYPSVSLLQPLSAVPASLLHCRYPSVSPYSLWVLYLLHCYTVGIPWASSLQCLSAASASLLHCKYPLCEPLAASECCSCFTVTLQVSLGWALSVALASLLHCRYPLCEPPAACECCSCFTVTLQVSLGWASCSLWVLLLFHCYTAGIPRVSLLQPLSAAPAS